MELNPRHLATLEALSRYKYRTSSALYLATKDLPKAKDEFRCLNRITNLRCFGYVTREDCDAYNRKHGIQRKTHDDVYSLTAKGRDALVDNGIEPTTLPWYTAHMEHDFETYASVSSIEQFAPTFDIEFLPFSFFALRSNNPKAYVFDNVAAMQGDKAFVPDHPIFGLRFTDKTIPIVGFETDRGGENIKQGDKARASVMKHILCYNELDQKNAFVGRFKLPSRKYYVLIQTSTETHKRNMMRDIEAKIGKSELFLFKVTPKWARFGTRKPPTDELLTTPWERMGHPPVVLSKG
jgi:hypothetical protein